MEPRDEMETCLPDDPIVEETRRAGQAYIDSFNGDWNAIIADLRHRAALRGAKTIARPPEPAVASETPSKKAG